MKIGILGAGRVGGALGRHWASAGHTLLYGEIEPNAPRVRELVAEIGPSATVTTPALAAEQADLVVLAVPWPAAPRALEAVRPYLSGKILIDVINPLRPDLSGLDLGDETSSAEATARRVPEARVVKAFNTISYGLLEAPKFPEGRATGLLCGDDPDANRVVAELVAQVGFEPLIAGPLREARTLEALALLWIRLVVTRQLPSSAAIAAYRKAPGEG